MVYEFNNNHEVVASVNGHATLNELEKEQGMYSATPEFCHDNGGRYHKSN